jgi:hypothetical protein
MEEGTTLNVRREPEQACKPVLEGQEEEKKNHVGRTAMMTEHFTDLRT